MAEVGVAVLTVLFDNIFNKVRSLVDYEFRLLQGGINEDLEKLSSTLSKFQRELQGAEVKEFKSAGTRDWFRRLKYVANEADGILEDALDSDSDDNDQRRVCSTFPSCFDFSRRAFHHKLDERIKSVTQKFDLLVDEKSTLDFEEIRINRETTSALSAPEVFGRNEAKEEIISTLLNKADVQTGGHPFIYAIVGLGGIGKTTLAQLIYNDKRVAENFDEKIWVWVSQTFDVKVVMEKVIDHFEKTKFESMETMHIRLSQLLNEKKFLLVLDDIWNEDLDEWNKLKSSLGFGAIGSSIILTTRGSHVASIVGSHARHDVALLSEDQCWLLFKESAFLKENQENGELEVIGKQIVRKCGGLPLAAKNLGGSLRLSQDVSKWVSVRDSDIWELERSGNILPALRLSLNSLSSHSRNCFAFASVFPKGYTINKEHLIQLWMANDLVPSRRRLDSEAIGNEICNELVLKSFFESSGDCVKMHDLMHDVGRSSTNECFFFDGPDVSNIPPHLLHLSINFWHPSKTNILETLSVSHPSLRTCILVNDKHNRYHPPTIKIVFQNLDCLRALDLSYAIMDTLPVSIGKIKHLKYLNLSRTGLTHVSDSICTLTKLQTLKLGGSERFTHLPDGIGQLINLRHLNLSGCRRLTHLPDGIAQLINLRHFDLSGCVNLTRLPVRISQMTNLRHVNLRNCSKLTQFPNGMGQLIYLQTLGLFIVSQERGQRITELQRLNHLRGSLVIRGLEHVKNAREAEEANLKEKRNITSLSLFWGDLQEISDSSNEAEDVLKALQPPQSLNAELFIKGYRGSVFASWIELLENLIDIKLIDCTRCEHLPPLGALPHLKVLIITGMKSLKCIGTEFYGSISSERRTIFPSLEELRFEDMPILEEWHTTELDSPQTSACPRLEKLDLGNCPELTLLPSLILSFVQQLQIHDCDKVIVRSLSRLTSLTLDGTDTNHVTSFHNESLQNLDALESLEIKNYKELIFLPEGLSNLTSLRRLEISCCSSLQSLPVIGSSLVGMQILECESLKSLSQGLQCLSALKSLTINSCDELEFSSEDFHNLISLRTLQLVSLPKLASFPVLQHLSTLQTLSIEYCRDLRLCPQVMQNLTVLESLTFYDCEQLDLSSADFEDLINLRNIRLYDLPKLTSLPKLHHSHSLKTMRIQDCKNLKVLPKWLQNLTSLQVLYIKGCHHDLHLQCDKDEGEYWPFISHIPQHHVHTPDCTCISCIYIEASKNQNIMLGDVPDLDSEM